MRPHLSIAAVTVLIAHALLAGSPARAETEPLPGLRDQTHAFFMPTGNTLRAGQTVVRSHGLFLYNQLAFGLSDHIEVSVGAPVYPFFANIGLRAQLLPRTSPLRLLVTGGFWKRLIEEDSVVVSSSVTLAYQSGTSNLHLTAGFALPVIQERMTCYEDECSSSGSDVLPIGLASVGAVSGKDRYALFVELGTIRDLYSYRDQYFGGLQLGLKIMRARFDVDLGLLVLVINGTSTPPLLPFLSTNYRF